MSNRAGVSDMREARVPDLVDIDHDAMGPVGPEVPWIDLRAFGKTFPALFFQVGAPEWSGDALAAVLSWRIPVAKLT